MMARRSYPDIITGIDIGSTAIRIAVGQFDGGSDRGRGIHIIGTAEMPSEGVQKGVVTSIEDAVSSLSGALEQIERLIGIPIESGWIGIGGTHIISQESKGVIAVAKADGEIEGDDVERAVEAARSVAPPLNYEMLHILTKGFTVDGQTGITDPTGMTGIRLEVDTQIIHGLTTHVRNVTKAVYRTGIEIDDLVLSSLATGDVVTTDRQRDLGTVVVSIGGSTTSYIVYEHGDVVHVGFVPVGSEHVTNDLAIGLRTSIDVAERVKIHYGHALSKAIAKKEKIELAELGATESEQVDRRFVGEIIEARMTELLEKIDEELNKIGKSGLLPAGAVFTGGGSKIPGLTELAKEVLALPASLGYPIDMMSSTEQVHDLAFSTAIGLVKWGSGLQSSGKRPIQTSAFVSKISDQVQKFFKSLIP
jgi:cell division protein FtsA